MVDLLLRTLDALKERITANAVWSEGRFGSGHYPGERVPVLLPMQSAVHHILIPGG